MTMIYLWLSMTIYDCLVHLFFSNCGVLPSPPTRWVSGGAAETASAWSQAKSHMDEGKTWKNRPENRSKPWTHSGWWFFALPLWKMMEWVTVGMIFPNTWMKKKKCSKAPTSILLSKPRCPLRMFSNVQKACIPCPQDKFLAKIAKKNQPAGQQLQKKP